ncbi:hypothetical protein CJJ07_003314 [Candidozyma auris]|nr:hypothetical protein CJJ07_003314 [[Candida] auris]
MEVLLEPETSDRSYGALDAVPEKSSKKKEVIFIANSSGPLIVTFILQFLLQTITIFACGRLGAEELAIASLALCTFNITGLALYQGLSTCLDSFCSQAYGAGRPLMVGLYFQRCTLIMAVITVFPLIPMWWYCGSLLRLLVPSENLAAQCQYLLRILTVGAPGFLLFENGKRFFQAQHIFNAGTYALAVSVPIHLLLNWLLVWHPRTGMGITGAAVALSLSFWITAALMFLYAVFINGRQCWGGLDLRKAMVNWRPMLKLALPGVIMVEAEYLAFEVMTILAASFGTTALAAQSIGANVGALFFQVPFAVSVAFSTRIGHYVGVPDIPSARLVSKLSLLSGIFMGILNFAVLFLGRTALARIYSDDPDVVNTASKLLQIAAINQICDCLNIVAAGILRGQGRQKIGSFMNLFSYYCIALPMAYVFAFLMRLEVYGLWLGLVCGVAVLSLGEVFCAQRGNWEKIVAKCIERHDH